MVKGCGDRTQGAGGNGSVRGPRAPLEAQAEHVQSCVSQPTCRSLLPTFTNRTELFITRMDRMRPTFACWGRYTLFKLPYVVGLSGNTFSLNPNKL